MSLVLLVEADADLGDLIRDVLEAAGYRVDRVHTQAGGLERVQRLVPDLVLLDVAAGPGRAFQEALRSHGKGEIPLVMISGDRGPQGAARAGGQGFLGVPFERHALLEQVASMISR